MERYNLDKYKTKSKRPVFSYRLFMKEYLSFDSYKQAEKFRTDIARKVLEKIPNANDIKFLERIHIYYFPNFNEDTELIPNVNGVYYSVGLGLHWSKLSFHSKYNWKWWKNEAKIMQDKYFKFSERNLLGFILFDSDSDYKLKFKNKVSEDRFLLDMKQKIERTNIIPYKDLARHIVHHTNTEKKESTILDFLNRR